MDDGGPPGRAGIGVGSRVAGYRIDAEIGRGGMAVVYRAHDPRLERRVALKILAPELAEDDAFRLRFIRESRAAAAVDHPNIIPVFEAGETGGVLFIAMQLVSAGDVQTLMDREGALPPGRACQIITQVAAALDAAHTQGLVHRDVKPANMLLGATAESDQDDHVYLSDFGLSKRALGSTQLTSAGLFLGTPSYISPEQIEGKPVDGRSDLYALACCAYAMLAGTPPFRRGDSMAVVQAQLSDEPPPLTAQRPGLPGAADEVLARALTKAPAGRYPTCREFAAQLRRACGLEPGRPATDSPAADSPATDSPAADSPAADSPARAAPPRREPTQAVPTAALAPAALAPAAPPGPGGEAAAPPAVPPVTAQAGQGPLTRSLRAPPAWPAPGGPDRTGPGGTAGNGPGAGGPGRPRRRRRSAVIAAVSGTAVLALAAGYLTLAGKGAPARHNTPVLAPPGCTAAVAKAGPVPHTPHQLTTIGGQPFDVATAPGGYAFATIGNGVMVLSTRQPQPVILWTRLLPHTQGEAITGDHRYLVVTDGAGVAVFRTQDLEQGPASPVGSLTSPGERHAVEVALTPDSRLAFVTFQGSAHVGVFNLRQALTSGFGPADLVGLIPVGAQPIGITVAPGGRYAYATSRVRGAPASAHGGVVNVISVPRAATHPATAVLSTAAAGCKPARVIASPDGRRVWVSATGSNSLLAFSAAGLAAGSPHALLARVAVGSQPLGLVFANGGSRLLVADSDKGRHASGTANLAVVNPARALAGRPGLLGYVPGGVTPRQFALAPRSRLLVTNTRSGQLETVSLAHLP